ncbi:MAG: type II toxin-antitoxin system HipA family toxin [Blastochloris sp.]|nr:type II toxin-antitoxin system HipA family toxin [Blastochloris sp.]
MTHELHALANGRMMGKVFWDSTKDKLRFEYAPSWQEDAQTYPLSLSMPLAATLHVHTVIEPFLWGLLPDNNEVLRRWGQRFQVSPRNPFKLLSHVGEDCAGAIQLLKPEAASNDLANSRQSKVRWLKEKDIAARMEWLRRDYSVWRTDEDSGQFSLAGAQPKTALYYDPDKNQWGVPSGAIPTTHIFKPANSTFAGYAENEHFCLRLAQELGLPSASSHVRYFDDIPVIVLERYDRFREKGKVIRIHQEDSCQALARLPQQKYQNDGGPSTLEIFTLLREWSSNPENDIEVFVKSLVLNWILYGTDAHAKNYSLLIAPGNQVRLAPLYDIASAIPYPKSVPTRKAKLAMKIGGQYLVSRIGRHEWEKFAHEHRLNKDRLMESILNMIRSLPDLAEQLDQEMRQQGIANATTHALTQSLQARCKECLSQM